MKVKILALFALAIRPAGAEPAVSVPSPSAPAISATEQQFQEIKNPLSWLSWGGDLRFRNEYINNALTLNPENPLHEQDYLRFRARLWTSVKPVEDIGLNLRVATEPREWLKPAGSTAFRNRSGFDSAEGIFDAVNVQWRHVAGTPASIIVGRQDILLGEGWLTGEGTPYDGSLSFYMDAARITYELSQQHTVVEAMGILQTAKDDAWMPTINNQNRYLSEQDETGAILNIVNSSIPEANVNAYFIYKHDNDLTDPGTLARGDNADIYTAGARISGLIQTHWKYSIEGAYQFGEKQDLAISHPSVSSEYRHINAFGFNGKCSYLFKDSLNNSLGLNYEYLTGDKPGTGKDEMFDVLWGRYPRWGEIGLYSFAAETRVGQQANYHRLGPIWSITPAKGLDFSAQYFAMFADQEVATRGASGLFTNSGNFAGTSFPR
jgi:hypothetical protein